MRTHKTMTEDCAMKQLAIQGVTNTWQAAFTQHAIIINRALICTMFFATCKMATELLKQNGRQYNEQF